MESINEILDVIEQTLRLPKNSIDELFLFNQEDNSVNKVILALEKKFGKKIPDNIIFITARDIIEFYGIVDE